MKTISRLEKIKNFELEKIRYWGAMPLPRGAQALGIVHRQKEFGGGLLLLLDSGIFVEACGGGIRTLNQREIHAQIPDAVKFAGVGNPPPAAEQREWERLLGTSCYWCFAAPYDYGVPGSSLLGLARLVCPDCGARKIVKAC